MRGIDHLFGAKKRIPIQVQSLKFIRATLSRIDVATMILPMDDHTSVFQKEILAAVMCDAEEPCSVDTACAPESSFTTFPYNDTCQYDTAFVFLNVLCNSEFLRCSVAKRTVLPSLCACSKTSCLLFTSDGKVRICSAFASGISIA